MALSAQDIAERSCSAMWAHDRASQAMGMTQPDVSPGRARLSLTLRADQVNGHGIAHGGVIFTLADSAFAFACNSYNARAVAHICTVTFLKPAYEGQTITADAREIDRAGRSGIYDVAVRNDGGEVIAQFRGHSRLVKGQHFEAPDG